MHAQLSWFGNAMVSLQLNGRDALMQIEKPVSGESTEPRLEEVFSYRLPVGDWSAAGEV
jgi:hypothetical protein